MSCLRYEQERVYWLWAWLPREVERVFVVAFEVTLDKCSLVERRSSFGGCIAREIGNSRVDVPRKLEISVADVGRNTLFLFTIRCFVVNMPRDFRQHLVLRSARRRKSSVNRVVV